MIEVDVDELPEGATFELLHASERYSRTMYAPEGKGGEGLMDIQRDGLPVRTFAAAILGVVYAFVLRKGKGETENGKQDSGDHLR